jgi:hypothetical protein
MDIDIKTLIAVGSIVSSGLIAYGIIKTRLKYIEKINDDRYGKIEETIKEIKYTTKKLMNFATVSLAKQGLSTVEIAKALDDGE